MNNDHGFDCSCESCGNHHKENEDRIGAGLSIPKGATTLSFNRDFEFKEPIPKTMLENDLVELFKLISEYVVVDGIVPGHLKGAVKQNSAFMVLSVTRGNEVNATGNGEWNRLDELRMFTLTVNVLSIFPCQLTVQGLEYLIIDKFIKK